MEELLRKLKIQSPPEGLRERVLAAARGESAKARVERDWLDRLWESRVFWCTTAASVALCLTAILLAPGRPASRRVATLSANPAAAALAKELAPALGDGPALERQLTAQLSGTAASGTSRGISMDELLRSIQ